MAPDDKFDILGTTTLILERSLIKSDQNIFAPWAWFARAWVKWHTLAVLLAELCAPYEGELADRAWSAAQQVFNQYSELVSQPDAGMLLKPVAKLFRRVQQLRGGSAIPPRAAQQLGKPDISVSEPLVGGLHFAVNGISHANVADDGVKFPAIQIEGLYLKETDPWYNWETFLNEMNGPDHFDSADSMSWYANWPRLPYSEVSRY